jgi:hypothetical protein
MNETPSVRVPAWSQLLLAAILVALVLGALHVIVMHPH